MTRRVSKRAMLHRLDSIPYARIHLDSLRSSSAHVVVDGIVCEVNFPRKARHVLLRESGVYGNLETIPVAIGDGYIPTGSKSGDYSLRNNGRFGKLPAVKIYDSYSSEVERLFEDFQEKNPIGTILAGQVRLINRRVAILDLGLGQQGQLDKGESLDHTVGSAVRWLPLPSLGECVDVMVRGFITGTRMVNLSMHSFQRDANYCSHSAGYRHGYSADVACFRKLPWENKLC